MKAFAGFFMIGLVVVCTLWAIWQQEGEIDVVEAVTQACQALTSTNYNLTTTMDAAGVGSATITSYYAGDDNRHIWTFKDANGTVTGQAETITKNGTLYSRETDPNNAANWLQWHSQAGSFGSEHLPCVTKEVAARSQVQPTSGAASFSDTRTPAAERRITSTITADDGTEVRETWVDANNVPLRGKRTITPTGGTSIVADLTFSGFGTTNTITAPSVP